MEPSVGAGDEAEAPEGELQAGDEGDNTDVDWSHQARWVDLDDAPYLARQLSVFVIGNTIYGAGRRIDSLMVAQDA